jgi:hypothetical protein
MKVDTKSAEKSLPKRGFRQDKGRDHVYYHFEFDGKETDAYTYVSHGSSYKEIGPDNLKSMRKQLKLETVKQTIDLLQCPMSERDYIECLVKAGILDADE